MPRLLLKIEKRAKWLPSSKQLVPGEAPADIIIDFRVSSSKLSVYVMDDDLIRAERTAIAFACNRENLQDIYYLLFDAQIVDKLGLPRTYSKGHLPDLEVSQWHQDIEIKTINQLSTLIHAIWNTPDIERPIEWIPIPNLPEKIREGVNKGHLVLEEIKKGIRQKVGLS